MEMHALPRRVVRAAVAGQLFLGAGVPWYVSGGPQVSGPPAEWRRNGQIPVSHTDAFPDAVITDAVITDSLIIDAVIIGAVPNSKRHAQISSRVRCVFVCAGVIACLFVRLWAVYRAVRRHVRCQCLCLSASPRLCFCRSWPSVRKLQLYLLAWCWVAGLSPVGSHSAGVWSGAFHTVLNSAFTVLCMVRDSSAMCVAAL